MLTSAYVSIFARHSTVFLRRFMMLRPRHNQTLEGLSFNHQKYEIHHASTTLTKIWTTV